MSRPVSPQKNYSLQQYKQKLIPKVSFADQKPHKPILDKPKPKPLPSRNTSEKKEMLETEQSLQLSRHYAERQLFTSRASQGVWSSDIIPGAQQIRAHMVDNERNLETTYSVAKEPLDRLKLLHQSIQVALDRGEFDPLFGHEQDEKPIIDLSISHELPIQLNPVQNITTQGQRDILETSTDSELQKLEQQPKPIFPSLFHDVQQRIQESDIIDFIDNKAQIEIFEEGRAVSELEMYNMVFDDTLSNISCQGYENYLNILRNIKNYYINKIVRRGTEFKAMQEATQKLDTRCVQAEKDAIQMREQLQLMNKEIEELKSQLKETSYQLEEANKLICKLEVEKESMAIQIETYMRQNNSFASQLKHQSDEIDDLNRKHKHLSTVSQRLRAVSDKTNERASAAERKLGEEIRKKQDYETKYQSETEKVLQLRKQLIDQQRVSELLMQNKFEEIEKLKLILVKYGETETSSYQDFINIDLKQLLINIVQVINGSDTFSEQSLSALKVMLQNILEFPVLEELQKSFINEFNSLVKKHSKEVQTNQKSFDERKKRDGKFVFTENDTNFETFPRIAQRNTDSVSLTATQIEYNQVSQQTTQAFQVNQNQHFCKLNSPQMDNLPESDPIIKQQLTNIQNTLLQQQAMSKPVSQQIMNEPKNRQQINQFQSSERRDLSFQVEDKVLLDNVKPTEQVCNSAREIKNDFSLSESNNNDAEAESETSSPMDHIDDQGSTNSSILQGKQERNEIDLKTYDYTESMNQIQQTKCNKVQTELLQLELKNKQVKHVFKQLHDLEMDESLVNSMESQYFHQPQDQKLYQNQFDDKALNMISSILKNQNISNQNKKQQLFEFMHLFHESAIKKVMVSHEAEFVKQNQISEKSIKQSQVLRNSLMQNDIESITAQNLDQHLYDSTAVDIQKQTNYEVSCQVDMTTSQIMFYRTKLDELIRRCESLGIIENQEQKLFFSNFISSINKYKDTDCGAYNSTISQTQLDQVRAEMEANRLLIQLQVENKQISVEHFNINDDLLLPNVVMSKYVDTENNSKLIQVSCGNEDFQMQTDQSLYQLMNIENSVYKVFNEANEVSIKNLSGFDSDAENIQKYPIFQKHQKQSYLNNCQIADEDIAIISSKKKEITAKIQFNENTQLLQQQSQIFTQQFDYNDQLQSLQLTKGYGELNAYETNNYKENDVFSQSSNMAKQNRTIYEMLSQYESLKLGSPKKRFQLSQVTESKIQQEMNQRLESIEQRPISKAHVAKRSVSSMNAFAHYKSNEQGLKGPLALQIIGDIPTFQDFQEEVQENFQVTKRVLPSFLDLHPKYGFYQKQEYFTHNQIEMEQIAVLHNADKIYLTFNPNIIKQNMQPILYPCILKQLIIQRELSNSSTKLQVQTYRQFQNSINQLQTNGIPYVSELSAKNESLLPYINDKILYIRVQSMCINKNRIPSILEQMEVLSRVSLSITKVEHNFYVKVPFENVQLKSLTWLIKLIRIILNSRLDSTVSYVQENTEITSFITDPNDKIKHRFVIVPGSIKKLEAENLASFIISWVQTKYGNRTLVMTLLWNLISNIVYYQFFNDEVYLFARFLFEDLEADMFLLFLELRRILRLNILNANVQAQCNDLIIKGEQVLIETIPSVVSTLMQNWEPKRQYALVQSIYAMVFQNNPNNVTSIPFIQLAQLIMFAAASYRKLSFQMAHLVYTHLAKESNSFPCINEAGFRQLCAILLPSVSQTLVNELYFCFSESEDQEKNYNQSDIVNDFRQRRMTFNNFHNLYQSMQLCRFSKISADIIEQTASIELKKLIRNSASIFNVSKQVISNVTALLSRAALLPGGQKFNLYYKQLRCAIDLCQCDLVGYDFFGVVSNFKQMINSIIDSLIQIRPEGCIALIGGAMQSLSHFLQNTYSEVEIE